MDKRVDGWMARTRVYKVSTDKMNMCGVRYIIGLIRQGWKRLLLVSSSSRGLYLALHSSLCVFKQVSGVRRRIQQ